MSKVIGIDMHNHVYPAGTEPHSQCAEARATGGTAPELFLADELKRSGFTAVCASFVLDFAQNDKPGDARDNYLRWLGAIDAQLAKGHLKRALTIQDLESDRESAT